MSESDHPCQHGGRQLPLLVSRRKVARVLRGWETEEAESSGRSSADTVRRFYRTWGHLEQGWRYPFHPERNARSRPLSNFSVRGNTGSGHSSRQNLERRQQSLAGIPAGRNSLLVFRNQSFRAKRSLFGLRRFAEFE